MKLWNDLDKFKSHWIKISTKPFDSTFTHPSCLYMFDYFYLYNMICIYIYLPFTKPHQECRFFFSCYKVLMFNQRRTWKNCIVKHKRWVVFPSPSLGLKLPELKNLDVGWCRFQCLESWQAWIPRSWILWCEICCPLTTKSKPGGENLIPLEGLGILSLFHSSWDHWFNGSASSTAQRLQTFWPLTLLLRTTSTLTVPRSDIIFCRRVRGLDVEKCDVDRSWLFATGRRSHCHPKIIFVLLFQTSHTSWFHRFPNYR